MTAATAAAVLALARRLADDVLYPSAGATDAAELVPRDRLDALAAAGLYGLRGPASAGGLELDPVAAARVVEVLASGCLTTTFVWLQHQGVVRAVAAGGEPLRSAWLGPLCRGERRAGIAIAGIRPGGSPLRVRRGATGWVLAGSVPWVTGWGRIDVVHTAALDETGDVVWLLVDVAEAASLRAVRQDLVAVDASGTVTVEFAEHPVASHRCSGRSSYAQWQADDAAGLRMNGSLALGLVRRCRLLLADAANESPARWLATQADAVRRLLDTATPAAMPAARAAAAELAWRAVAVLATAGGSRSVRADQAAGRLAREALFLLVFGTRAQIKADLLRRLTNVAPINEAPK